jgi:hypothetical protein
MADPGDKPADTTAWALSAAPALAGIQIADDHKAGVLMYLRIGLARAEAIGPVGPDAGPIFRA